MIVKVNKFATGHTQVDNDIGKCLLFSRALSGNYNVVLEFPLSGRHVPEVKMNNLVRNLVGNDCDLSGNCDAVDARAVNLVRKLDTRQNLREGLRQRCHRDKV